jgi:GalNAc-alpha-(1->4)-GalNAc-alpha-(1->3)-diNAcBac-PP-undecaprenol alpha-1,4-N-acetyl-D-galactosaminyltransferase
VPDNNQKIFIVLPHLTLGGTERTAAVLANYLAGKGDEVIILLMYRKPIFYTVEPSVKIIQPPDIRQRVGKLLYIPYVLGFIRSHVRKEKPDIVFCLGYIAFTLVATLGLSSKVVISGRSSPSRVRFPSNPPLNALYKLSHRVLRGRVNGIVAQTEVAANSYGRKYSSAIKVIPNFLRELVTHEHKPLNQIITVGRLAREKGHIFLIEAFARINAPGWSLILVGEGPERPKLEQLAKTVDKKITFAGAQRDVDYFLSQSKIFVFTSLHEGFPNALVEAMATPLACVSFDCDAGPAEIITNGENGFLVEVGNVNQLTTKIQYLIDNDEACKIIKDNAKLVREKFSLSRIGTEYRQFFFDVINNVNSGKSA